MIPDELKPDMRQRFFLFFEEQDLQVRKYDVLPPFPLL